MGLVKSVKKSLGGAPWLYQFILWLYSWSKQYKEAFFSLFFRIFPVDKNKIVINNHRGKGYGDNAKYIVEEIIRNNKNYDIVWLLEGGLQEISGLPECVRIVKYGSIRSIYEMTTANIWIDNNRVQFFVFKRKKQFYIQTWHGGLGLKKIGGDALYGLKKEYMKYAMRDSKMADLFISNSQHLSDIYRRAFWYDGDILESGYPKNDILFSDKAIFRKKIRDVYGVREAVKILLYAPTFREDYSVAACEMDFVGVLESLNRQEHEWIILVRLHPNVDEEMFGAMFSCDVVNATAYPDMQELVLGIDALVTDYSSCMFDSALANIPTFLYASDVDDYMKNDRGFYFLLDELPFSFARNTRELIKNISDFKEEDYSVALQCFYEKVGLYDKGDASKKVFEVIRRRMIS